MNDSPILFIDADEDDQHMFQQALAELGITHPVITFSDGQAALNYLTSSPVVIFLIISEISMPGMTGLELRQQIEHDPLLRKKSIPFIFMTSPVEPYLVDEAYEMTIQGLFEKRDSFLAWREQLRSIIAYWTECQHPNQFSRKLA